MIYGVRCDQPQFKAVTFQPGFNVVLAERTKESTKKDSRNGLGKSTLIQIIHFCLGASFLKDDPLHQKSLENWTFTLDIDLGGRQYAISRNTKYPNYVVIDGDTSGWPLSPDTDKKTQKDVWLIKKFNRILGWLVFGLPVSSAFDKYSPSFRSLISYFIRRGPDAYSIPFEHARKQLVWDIQLHNAFLLGLGWEYAQKWQVLKDREKNLKLITEVAKTGSDLLAKYVGSLGELEATRITLEEQVRQEEEQLNTFQVHPQYYDIRERANTLTEAIHSLTNENIQSRRMIGFYQTNLAAEQPATSEAVTELYEEVGVALSENVVKRLEDVQKFHQQVITNRREFLASEVQRLTRDVSLRERQIRDYTTERASLLNILSTQGALEEYTKLQERHSRLVSELEAIKTRIENLRQFEQEKSALKIEIEQLTVDARSDNEERKSDRERAVSLFNANSEALYEAPGVLIVNIEKTGFKFQVDIKRSGSEGIDRMKVFCYDLMLAQSWAQKESGPGFLIHDSTIFDGVDERQRALALQLAARATEQFEFQYICCYNSDLIPLADFDEGFNFYDYVCLTLTDSTEDGGLLGIRF